MMVRRTLAALLGASVFLLPLEVRAGEVVYRAPPECPSQSVIASRLAGSESRAASIEVSGGGAAYKGEIVLGEGSARTIEGRTCAAVVEALLLIASLDTEKDEVPIEPEPNVTKPTAVAEPIADVVPPAADVGPAQPMRKETRPVDIALGVGAFVTSFADGNAFQGGSIFGEVAAKAPVFSGIWPSARIGVSRTLPLHVARSYAVAHFVVTSATVDLCPFGVAIPEASLSLAACARGEVGALDASTTPVANAGATQLWSRAGGLGRVRFAPRGSGLRPFVEVSGGAMAPLVRDRFLILDERIEPSVLAWSGSIQGGVVLP
jgi:hypothetical protein